MDKIKLLDEIKKSSKYKTISEDLILRLIDQNISKGIKEKEIIKNIKEQLHRTHELFLPDRKALKEYIEELDDNSKDSLIPIMSKHLSTKERLNFSKEMYHEIFNERKNLSILDIGCGLNAIDLYLNGILNLNQYTGIEIDENNVEFLNEFFKKFKINGKAYLNDVMSLNFDTEYDIVLLLKVLPILEQQKKGSTEYILNNLNAKEIVISFPLKTVSGRDVGMLENYDKIINERITNLNRYKINRKLVYSNEIVYIVLRGEK